MEHYSDYFADPSITGIALAFLFIAILMACYWPHFNKYPWLWAVLVFSAFFSTLCITYVLIPLIKLIDKIWPPEYLLSGQVAINILKLVIGGLVYEGAKFVSVLFVWWRLGKHIDAKFGIILGAVAGAGLALIEAQSIHNQLFNYIATAETWVIISSLIINFFVVVVQISTTALAGYGLATGRGWQYFLLAVLFHIIFNIIALVSSYNQILSLIVMAIWALLITAYMLRLRWKKDQSKASE